MQAITTTSAFRIRLSSAQTHMSAYSTPPIAVDPENDGQPAIVTLGMFSEVFVVPQ
jgi:hypothetical protein